MCWAPLLCPSTVLTCAAWLPFQNLLFLLEIPSHLRLYFPFSSAGIFCLGCLLHSSDPYREIPGCLKLLSHLGIQPAYACTVSRRVHWYLCVGVYVRAHMYVALVSWCILLVLQAHRREHSTPPAVTLRGSLTWKCVPLLPGTGPL